VYTLEQVQKKRTRQVLVAASSVKLDADHVAELKKLMGQHKGHTPVRLEIADLPVVPAVLVTFHAGTINIQNGGVEALRQVFGEEAVMMLGEHRRAHTAPRTAAVREEMPLEEEELVEA
jgi:hypothetical protein